MKHYALFAATSFLFASPAASETAPNGSHIVTPTCNMVLDFQNESEISQWQTVLDGVMGGRSTGARFAEEKHMVFKGNINTNGGGFSSIRRSMKPGEISGAKSLKLRLRQDGRSYRLTFRTRANYWGRPISYQLPIPKTSKNVWTEVSIPLSGFRTSIFGRRVEAPPFDPSDVWEMGVIIADGVDGPFEINIGSLTCA